MYSTLSQLMSAVTTDAGRRADVDASLVSRFVNDAMFEVAYATDPAERESIAVSSTTTGENKIELPTDFLEPISATLVWLPSWSTSSSAHSSYYTLQRISIADIDARNPQPGGVPRQIAFFNSWMELYPSPNSAYSLQLRYLSGVTEMVEGADVPSVSTPWRKAVKLKAEENLQAFLQDPVAEAAANVRYLRYVSQLKTDEARRQAMQTPFRVTPQYGNYGGRRKIGGVRQGRRRTWNDCE